MNRPGFLTQSVSLFLAVMIFQMSVISAPVKAAMIDTEQLSAAVRAETTRTRLHRMLMREDLQSALMAQGIFPSEARSRVDSLSDSEAIQLAGKLDELPAGGGVLGTLVTAGLIVFLVLLFTDIMGYTDVYPFVKKHARH